jgi:hypothetical protein
MVPNHGSRYGLEQVVLSGQGIDEPAQVFFTVDGEEYQAQTVSVVPSDPPDALGSITINTPPITGISHDPVDLETDFLADVRVTVPCDPNNPDTPDCEATSPRQEETYIQAFTFDRVGGGGDDLQLILPLVPNEGSRYGTSR